MCREACAAALVACLVLAACGSSRPPPSSSSSGGPGPGDASSPSDASGSAEGTATDATSEVAPSTADATSGMADVALLQPPTDAAFLGDAGLPRTFTVTNDCTQTVWAAALPATTFPGGLVEMAPGYSFEVGVPNGWSGRVWGKTLCTTSGGTTTCQSSAFPASLAELTLTTSVTGLDFYDVSLVDGFNLPIALDAVGRVPEAGHPYDCGSPTCAVNLDATCAAPFQDLSSTGQVIACANDACKVIGDDEPDAAACVYPNQYTEFFKTACPQAYSYPYDDPTSTFTCEGFNDYAIVFCP